MNESDVRRHEGSQHQQASESFLTYITFSHHAGSHREVLKTKRGWESYRIMCPNSQDKSTHEKTALHFIMSVQLEKIKSLFIQLVCVKS